MSGLGVEQTLFEQPTNSHLKLIRPSSVKVNLVKASEIARLQPQMSKAVWRPAPGRKLGFKITHEDSLLGIAFFASPVINMSDRDAALGLPKDPSEKGKALRSYADLSVCVAAQPFGWYWNGGKLIAMLATTFGDFWQDRYEDVLIGVTTTSLWGKGSQYNRIYKFLGYTKGFGHQHIDDQQYGGMIQWMKENNVEIPSCRFGAGSNPRMRRIQAYRKASGDKSVTLMHGQKRGIYYHPARPYNERHEVVREWFDRWGLPRYERKKNDHPPYTDGLS
jgi:hypothetical protein